MRRGATTFRWRFRPLDVASGPGDGVLKGERKGAASLWHFDAVEFTTEVSSFFTLTVESLPVLGRLLFGEPSMSVTLASSSDPSLSTLLLVVSGEISWLGFLQRTEQQISDLSNATCSGEDRPWG